MCGATGELCGIIPMHHHRIRGNAKATHQCGDFSREMLFKDCSESPQSEVTALKEEMQHLSGARSMQSWCQGPAPVCVIGMCLVMLHQLEHRQRHHHYRLLTRKKL